MKILRFDDDRIGILKNGTHVVDVSDIISHRAERGPQRVMEVLIENFDALRGEIERMVRPADGVALSSVELLAPKRSLLSSSASTPKRCRKSTRWTMCSAMFRFLMSRRGA